MRQATGRLAVFLGVMTAATYEGWVVSFIAAILIMGGLTLAIGEQV